MTKTISKYILIVTKLLWFTLFIEILCLSIISKTVSNPEIGTIYRIKSVFKVIYVNYTYKIIYDATNICVVVSSILTGIVILSNLNHIRVKTR
jgi:hypothetical protein